MRTILVTGGAGQVGHELKRHGWPESFRIVAPHRGELELTDAAAVAAFVEAARPAAIVNAAAYTAVDKAETEVAAAFAVNAAVPEILARAAASVGAASVQVSTDYVFDGGRAGAYETDDPVAPLGVYGASKAAGEAATLAGNPRSAVVRTSWVVSSRRSNFLKTMLRLGRERETVQVVDDQRGRPTIASELAAALAAITLRLVEDETAPRGVFHFANDGTTSWRGFAEAIFEAAAARGLPVARVEAVPTEAFPTPAARPKNSELSTARITRELGVRPRPWRDLLPGLIDEILSAERAVRD